MLPRPLQELDARHARHALVAQQQRHRLLARLQLRQRIQRRLSAGRAHHPVFRPYCRRRSCTTASRTLTSSSTASKIGLAISSQSTVSLVTGCNCFHCNQIHESSLDRRITANPWFYTTKVTPSCAKSVNRMFRKALKDSQ